MGIHPIHSALAEDVYVQTLISVKAHQLLRNPAFYDSEYGDLEHELAVYVLKQAKHYDPARGSVHTFIDRVIDSCAKMLLRTARAAKRSGGPISSLDAIVSESEGRPVSLGDVVTNEDADRRTGSQSRDPREQRELELDVEAIKAGLDPKLLEVCRLRPDFGEQDIADSLETSRRQLRKELEIIRQRFKLKGFGS